MESGNLKNIPDNIPRVKQVVVDEEKFTIHCYRYAAMSDFFYVLLTQEFTEKNMETIKLCGIDSNVFCKVHELLNTGKVNLNYEDAVKVYTACRYLLVKDILLEGIQKFILENLDHMEVLDLYHYCAISNDHILLEGMQEFMLENLNHLEVLGFYYYCAMNNDPMLNELVGYLAPRIESVYQTKEFQALPVEAVLRLVTDGRVKLDKEDGLCWVIATWLAHSEERKIYLDKILRKINPTKFNVSWEPNFPDEWNVTTIANTLYIYIFEWEPAVLKPLKSEFFKPDEPLYVGNEDGLLVVTHFNGSDWSIQKGLRKLIHPCTYVEAAVRLQADLFVATSVLKESRFQYDVVHYSFRSGEMVEMRQSTKGEIKGLHLVNGKVFSNTGHIIQQYCAEHDLWLNPIYIELSDPHFSATDSQRVFIGGDYDWCLPGHVQFYDPREGRWTYLTDMPREYEGMCGTFVENSLIIMALGKWTRNWRILSVDVRNYKWETIVYHSSRPSAVPLSISRFRDNLVVMDHLHNIHISSMRGADLRLFENYPFAQKPVYSVD